jgi:hypothetical protein
MVCIYHSTLITSRTNLTTAVGGDNNQQNQNQGQSQQGGSSNEQQQGGGFLDGITNKLNGAAGGGKEGEKNEDYLDKGRSQQFKSKCGQD